MGIDAANANDIRPAMNVVVHIGSSTDIINKYFYDYDLLRVVVSLRSDLSPINPTLPESEIEIEVYYEDDISEQVAMLKEGTSVTFRAGYESGSPYNEWANYRYFYTDEPIRWENNVLYIHAVDQVNKLDGILSPIYMGQQWEFNLINHSYYGAFGDLYSVFFDILQGRPNYKYTTYPSSNYIIQHFSAPYGLMPYALVWGTAGHYTSATRPENGAINSIIPSMTRREMIAKLMNLCHQEYPHLFFNNLDNFWLTYVDAGQPTLSYVKPSSKYTIYETDCANIVNKKDRRVSEYQFNICDVEHVDADNVQGMDYVNASIFKEKGMALEYSGLVDSCSVGIRVEAEGYKGVQNIWEIDVEHDWPEKARPYDPNWSSDFDVLQRRYYGQWLLDENLPQSDWRIDKYMYYDLSSLWNTPNHDGETPAAEWADWVATGSIAASATETSGTSRGTYFITTNERKYNVSTGNPGIIESPEEYIWNGHIYAKSWNDNSELRILPDEGLKAIAKRSSQIGSFTWKGDPRMQPRDVFTFVYMERDILNENGAEILTENGETLIFGGVEDRTIENITMTFEKGGFISEITYRKGIV